MHGTVPIRRWAIGGLLGYVVLVLSFTGRYLDRSSVASIGDPSQTYVPVLVR